MVGYFHLALRGLRAHCGACGIVEMHGVNFRVINLGIPKVNFLECVVEMIWEI